MLSDTFAAQPGSLRAKLRGHAHRAERGLMKHGLYPPQDWSGIDQVFVVSTGRTGTTFFAELFGRLEHVYARHEPRPEFLHLSVDYAAGRVSFEDARRSIDRNRRALCRRARWRGCTTYVESNNRLFSLLRPLREVFPRSKIIHVVRDGRDVVRSGMSRPWFDPDDWSPRIQPAMFADDPWAARWPEMTKFEKIAWLWQRYDGIIDDGLRGMDGVMTVRFEELFKDPEQRVFFEVAAFMGFTRDEVRPHLEELSARKINRSSAFEIPKWPEWDEEQKRSFDAIAADHMRRHYAYEPMV